MATGPAACWPAPEGSADSAPRKVATREYSSLYWTRPRRHNPARPPRYALAVARAGQPLQGDVRALHECDVTLCVRVVGAEEIAAGVRAHVTAGTQQENMEQMAARGRGGGRPRVIARGAGLRARRERALALREAVRSGWDSAAVEAAMLGGQPRLW